MACGAIWLGIAGIALFFQQRTHTTTTTLLSAVYVGSSALLGLFMSLLRVTQTHMHDAGASSVHTSLSSNILLHVEAVGHGWDGYGGIALAG